MPETTPATLILAVPGTQETREWDFQTVRDAVARGEIGLDNWAWSPSQSNWLPLAQLPEFAPVSDETAPDPDQPKIVPVPVPIRVSPAAGTTTVVAAAKSVRVYANSPAAKPQKMAATYYSKPMEDHNEFPIFKILFAVLGLLIAGLVGVNYFLVDQPFRDNFSRTPFASVTTHAHLGAFAQPNALLIHVVPSADLNADNFADFLSALTHSAPSQAFGGIPFTSFSLTSAWLGQYMIGADDWKGFADMAGLSADQKKKYVLEHLETSTGAPLVPFGGPKETAAARAARADKAWNELVARFHARS